MGSRSCLGAAWPSASLLKTTRFYCLTQDRERLSQTLADLRVVPLVCLELRQAVNHAAIDNSFWVGNNDLIRSFLDQNIPYQWYLGRMR
jgi:hypothetical protein